MSSPFSEEILIDKLAKLNSTQQSIQTLSQWCIVHRSEAELVVTTWEKQFHSTEITQKVPLLYLANDILQNSKRQGNEFVQEFWKVLPGALKDLVSLGDDHGKSVVSRLVTIWEERRVFGSRSKSLKDVMLSEEAPPPLDINKKRSQGSKSAKRDSKSAKTKLSSGRVTEKIVSAFNLVRAENSNEETEISKCKSTVKRIRTMEKDVEDACSTAKDPRRKTLAKELEEEEITLRQSVEKLKSIEENRTSLVKHLREALCEQESELENLQSQIQVAQVQTEEAQNMQKRLNNETTVNSNNGSSGQSAKATPASIAAMAEMLTSSSNSSMIMHSVLSSFAAEATTQTSGLTKSNSADTNAFAPPNPQYHMIPNPAASQQFIPYGFGNIPLMPPGQLPPPPGSLPPHMMSNQQNAAQQQSQQGQSFQPPGMMYFGPPHHS
ncbi:PREDICTED: regulation of nuclear pre-mRNA domain-containing protein 1A isoform X2 [Camelina sativa]|uniref:Regulation of nuclear pre-mRNA domain-containing protein 1A isoform X1 n=1 Tax=Camelina sativa TaxID=90675 RepID=A0ABM0XDK0_CAMSA|nr:PREDICTED: regulation of nuclear pre-mRNA domain-containing protein 1A isoform X1 [Camelina sativa]XP_010484326.1 PREDICTED: regulation of nuclear pre-mRNA domain-containing protein 1A isoform X2 [Camelina sativa]